jgi:hypothetical protein
MWARVASFEGGDMERLRAMSEERMQQRGMPSAVKGTLVLADSAGKRRLFITFFDSKEAIEETEEEFNRMGDEIPEDIRGRRTNVLHTEVVYDDRP